MLRNLQRIRSPLSGNKECFSEVRGNLKGQDFDNCGLLGSDQVERTFQILFYSRGLGTEGEREGTRHLECEEDTMATVDGLEVVRKVKWWNEARLWGLHGPWPGLIVWRNESRSLGWQGSFFMRFPWISVTPSFLGSSLCLLFLFFLFSPTLFGNRFTLPFILFFSFLVFAAFLPFFLE